VAFIYAREVFNRTVLFRDDIETFTPFPIIGEIAYEKSNSPIVIENGKPGIIVEQFRKLRTSFHYLGLNAKTRKKILITSTISGEGKSFTALNLSLTLAAEGKKVVILEADLRKPTLYKKLGLTETEGIANYLLGELELESILKPTEFTNLSIIPAGPFQDNSSALFLNGRIEALLSSLEETFDYIIIDSAPAGLLSDAYILSPLCDATLYVVRHKYTPKMHLKTLEENSRIYELRNLAIVFNSVHSRGFAKNSYGYTYGYGYAK
jgi:capsular exopolysaccharide synthesis family protein